MARFDFASSTSPVLTLQSIPFVLYPTDGSLDTNDGLRILAILFSSTCGVTSMLQTFLVQVSTKTNSLSVMQAYNNRLVSYHTESVPSSHMFTLQYGVCRQRRSIQAAAVTSQLKECSITPLAGPACQLTDIWKPGPQDVTLLVCFTHWADLGSWELAQRLVEKLSDIQSKGALIEVPYTAIASENTAPVSLMLSSSACIHNW